MRSPNDELKAFCSLVNTLGCHDCASANHSSLSVNDAIDPFTLTDMPTIFQLIFDSNHQAMLDKFNQFSVKDFEDINSQKLRQAKAECAKLQNVPLPAKFFLIYILKRFYMECQFDVKYSVDKLAWYEKQGAKLKYGEFALESVALTHMQPYLQHIMKHMIVRLGFPIVPDPKPVYKETKSNSSNEYSNSGDDPDRYSKSILAKMLRSVLSISQQPHRPISDAATSGCASKISGSRGCDGLQGLTFGFSFINLNHLQKAINLVSSGIVRRVEQYIDRREQGSCLDCLYSFKYKSKQYKIVAAKLLCLIASKLPDQLDHAEPAMEIDVAELNTLFASLNLSSPFSQLSERKRHRVLATVMAAMTSGFFSKLSNHALSILENPTHIPKYDQDKQAYIFDLSPHILVDENNNLNLNLIT